MPPWRFAYPPSLRRSSNTLLIVKLGVCPRSARSYSASEQSLTIGRALSTCRPILVARTNKSTCPETVQISGFATHFREFRVHTVPEEIHTPKIERTLQWLIRRNPRRRLGPRSRGRDSAHEPLTDQNPAEDEESFKMRPAPSQLRPCVCWMTVTLKTHRIPNR